MILLLSSRPGIRAQQDTIRLIDREVLSEKLVFLRHKNISNPLITHDASLNLNISGGVVYGKNSNSANVSGFRYSQHKLKNIIRRRPSHARLFENDIFLVRSGDNKTSFIKLQIKAFFVICFLTITIIIIDIF